MAGYLLGVDAGTTSFKLSLFTENGTRVHTVKEEYVLSTPEKDWVEYPAESYWQLLCRLIRRLLAESNVEGSKVASLAISSQGETLICLDENGQPLMPAIVWLDNRSDREAGELGERFDRRQVYEKSGQALVTATWPATKILWLKKHRPEVFGKTKHYLLLEDYLLYRLTGIYAGEENLWASSLLYDINQNGWWEEMLAYLDIRKEQLPEIKECGTYLGNVCKEAAKSTGLSEDTKAVTGALDQTCGAIGAGKIFPGEVTETTGSCLAVSAPTDHFIPYCEESPITCQNHAVRGRYTVLLWSQTAGMVLKWYAETFWKRELAENGNVYPLIDREAMEAPAGSNGLIMLPHLSGASNPEYNANAKGVFYGMTLGHDRKHFSRAILEAIAYMLRRNIEQIEGLGQKVTGIYSMGGGSGSDIWSQIKADVTKKKVEVITEPECACKGAAILAAVGMGLYPDVDTAARRFSAAGKIFIPEEKNASVYDTAFADYVNLYEALVPMFR